MDVLVWMYDSRSHLVEVYGFAEGAVNETYTTKNTLVIEKQLIAGGLRLSALLNEIFGKKG